MRKPVAEGLVARTQSRNCLRNRVAPWPVGVDRRRRAEIMKDRIPFFGNLVIFLSVLWISPFPLIPLGAPQQLSVLTLFALKKICTICPTTVSTLLPFSTKWSTRSHGITTDLTQILLEGTLVLSPSCRVLCSSHQTGSLLI